jgi:hypothetical protein
MQIQLAMRHDRNGTLWISRNKKQYSTLDTIKPARYFIPRGNTAATPKRMAIALHLEDPKLYTGHAFRRTSATLCAESGMTVAEIKLVTGI